MRASTAAASMARRTHSRARRASRNCAGGPHWQGHSGHCELHEAIDLAAERDVRFGDGHHFSYVAVAVRQFQLIGFVCQWLFFH
jgi:hypothetical protein